MNNSEREAKKRKIISLSENRTGRGIEPERKAEGLFELIKECVSSETIMAEIGCYKGVSTECFALFCKKIYAVDPWEEASKEYREFTPHGLRAARRMFETRMENYDNVKVIQDMSVNASSKFKDETLDLVYLDGSHKYVDVVMDIKAWHPKIKTNGFLCGHDGNFQSVRKALLDCMYIHLQTDILRQSKMVKMYKDSSWSIKKYNNLA